MSTGTDGNGLTAPSTWGSRVQDYSAQQQILSGDLNTRQDRTITLGDDVAALLALVATFRTASGNQADVPAAELHGGQAVWFEALTNGTTVVVVDDTIDWRDRYVLLLAYGAAANVVPGGVNDDSIDANLTGPGFAWFFYSEAGQDGSTGRPGATMVPVGATDTTRFFARDTDGALCLVKDGTVDGNLTWLGLAVASPKQGHETSVGGHSLTAPAAYGGRVATYAPGSQVASADLNAEQDRQIALSGAIVALYPFLAPFGTASGNEADAPAPTPHGTSGVWFERTTNETGVLTLDDTVDWRGRFGLVFALGSNNPADAPGGLNDHTFSANLSSGGDGAIWLVYFEDGHDGGETAPGAAWVPAGDTDEIRLFARDSDGALCLTKNGTVDSDYLWAGLVVGSPQQNH